MRKKIMIAVLLMTALLCMNGCGNTNKTESQTSKISDSEIAAIQIGNEQVYLDEAKYYLYTSQASYETYYLTQGKEMQWDSIMTNNSTWEQVVKAATLDDICTRECVYALRDQYNVALTDDEKELIEKKVETYYTDTDELLQKKIGIEKARLQKIYEKEMLVKKINDVLEALSVPEQETSEHTNQKLKEIYREWKNNNEITVLDSWGEIHFNVPIFTKEDLTKNQVLTTEETSKK